MAPEVVQAILPFLYESFGNPSSSHAYGQEAARALAHARGQASLIGAEDDEILFTANATEANNMALLGVASAMEKTSRRHIVISAIEHPAVMQPALQLRARGWEVTIVPVDTAGRVLMSSLAEVLRPDTGKIDSCHVSAFVS